MRKLKIIRIVLWVLLLAVLAMIFCFSAQSGETSNGASKGIAQVILRVIRPDFSQLSQHQQNVLVEKTNLILRKGLHFAEYALLAFVTYLLLSAYSLRLRVVLSWLGATVYAVTDEVHQLYVGARMGSGWDVLIDSLGAAAGVALACALVYSKRKKVRKV